MLSKDHSVWISVPRRRILTKLLEHSGLCLRFCWVSGPEGGMVCFDRLLEIWTTAFTVDVFIDIILIFFFAFSTFNMKFIRKKMKF